jgi:hypothetical protein
MPNCHLKTGDTSNVEIDEMTLKDSNKRFLELVEGLKMSNKDIAALMGIHERTYYRWVSGDTRVPTSAIKMLELLKKVK